MRTDKDLMSTKTTLKLQRYKPGEIIYMYNLLRAALKL